MIADLTEKQRELIKTGDRTAAARRLRELLVGRHGLGAIPSREECDAIVDVYVAAVEQARA